MNKAGLITVGWLAAVLCAAVVAAQPSPDQQVMASQLRLNQEELKEYSWTSKITYSIDGVQKRVAVFKVRHAFDALLKTQTSGEIDKEKVRRPDGKKLSKKEREQAYAFVTEVDNQLDAYLNPLFSERAVATASMTTSGDTLVLTSHDVVTKGDEVEIHYSLPGRLPTQALVTTTVAGSPVSLKVEFAELKFGTVYPARSVTTTTWQGFQLDITTENSEYEHIDQ